MTDNPIPGVEEVAHDLITHLSQQLKEAQKDRDEWDEAYMRMRAERNALRDQLRWRVIADRDLPDPDSQYVLMHSDGKLVVPDSTASVGDVLAATHWLPIPPFKDVPE